MTHSMKQHEVSFRCNNCKTTLKYKETYGCPKCGKYLGWKYINKVYEDKYLEIYEIGV